MTQQHHSTLRGRNQITLPPAVRDALRVDQGDEILFHTESDGTVRLVAARLIPASQAWFWTDEWQDAERQFDLNRAAGRTTGPMAPEDFFAWLNHESGTNAAHVRG